jgi:cobalt-zinc-cadmium efflux system protein
MVARLRHWGARTPRTPDGVLRLVDGHGHGAPAEHVGRRYRGRLAASFALTAAFFVVELVAGLTSGSLALIADAGHTATDAVALGAGLLAIRIASRPDHSGRRSYGSYRAEVFASGLAVLLMYGVGAYVVIEAVRRIGSEPAVGSGTMVAVGLLGLLVNLLALVLLRAGSRQSLAVRGAYLEVLGDAVGSFGVLLAAGLIAWSGSASWDTLVAVGIGGFVVLRAISLGRQVLAVLNQQVPAGMDIAIVEADLRAVPGVSDVHDLHLWTLTSGMHVATAHLVAGEDVDQHAVLDGARDVLRDQHGIAHATLQVEPSTHRGCAEVTW